MGPLQGLVAEKLGLVLGMGPLQGLVSEKLGLVLGMGPLQGLVAENGGDDRTMSCRATSGSRDISLEISPLDSLSRYEEKDSLI